LPTQEEEWSRELDGILASGSLGREELGRRLARARRRSRLRSIASGAALFAVFYASLRFARSKAFLGLMSHGAYVWFAGTAIVGVVGLGLHRYKAWNRNGYGLLELLVAATVTFEGLRDVSGPTPSSGAAFVKVAAALYLFARGFENWRDGEAGRDAVHRTWLLAALAEREARGPRPPAPPDAGK
jgi:hypothetical protein